MESEPVIMKQLRQYIRQILLESPELQDELGEFVHNREDPAYDVADGTAHREYQKVISRAKPSRIDQSFELRREVKRFWNENADHNFWQDSAKVIAIHDLTYYAQLGDEDDDPEWTRAKGVDDIREKDLSVPLFMKKYPPGAIQRDEMSTYGYVGPLNGIFPIPVDLGLILDPRRVTFASAVDAYTESRGQATYSDRERHKGSGLPKRPRVGQYFDSGQVLFDQADVKKAGHAGELVVDNWSYSAIVINPDAVRDAEAIAMKAKAGGLRVFHSKTGKEV